MAKDIRIDLGFAGGGSTTVGVPEESIDAWRDAVKAGDGWHSVVSTDGTETLVDLSKLVYVRVGTTSKAIGFAHI